MTESLSSILLVDDEPSNLLALEAILEPLGQRLVRATTAKEALMHALRTDFCVVVLDVQMPEMDGFECAEILRSRPRTRSVPIIFATAISKDREFIARGYGVGAVDYLFKPYEPDVLRSKVAVFVELARKNGVIRAQHDALQQMAEREIAEIRRWSEQRYADLADAMPLFVWSADEQGRIAYVNERWRSVAGDAPLELASVVHPDDLDRLRDAHHAAMAEGSEWETEARFGSPLIGWRFHVARGVPRRDDSGKIVAWIGTSTDIDGRVRAERAVRILADASRTLAGTGDPSSSMEVVVRSLVPRLADAALLSLDGARQVRVARDGLEPSLLEDPRFDLGPSTVLYSQRAEVFRDVASDLREASSTRGAEHLRFLAELGVSAYMCLPLPARESALGTLTLFRTSGDRFGEDEVVVATDLASRLAVAIENARLQEASEKRRVELEEANRGKDVFLATLSHELRTPLNAIIGWTDMMRNGQLAGDELTRAVETIDRNAHALAGLVADLLDVSRIVTATLKLDMKNVSLASIVEAAIENARPACASKQVTLDASLPRIGCVNGDLGRLRQVFGNLLSNAIKFTPSGGKIAVRVEDADGRGRIVIEDTGEGIDADFLPHVFERFRQAETARARGLGLGLAIVKHLVDAHGGTVRVESPGKGKGSTFIVELPLSVDVEEVDGDARSSQPSPELPELGGTHVLVVEDDPDGNELITTILERYGARVTSVATAAKALEALEAEPPDVLVSDIGLPDADGMELIRQVRERPEGQDLPAIALTAYASRQDAAKAISAGFDAHVAKPVQPATLGGAVARLAKSQRRVPASSQSRPVAVAR
ncbi:MAG TPA: response regulator [Labilithrix sp.]